jgi:signal transduction histidine kinase
VLALHEDGAGVLWIGTRRGLARLEGDRLASFGPPEGLRDGALFHVLEDGTGALWLAGVAGVSRVARRELEDVAAGRARSARVVHYGAAAGIPDGACSGGSQPSAWRDRHGRLWFATESGVAVLHPSAVRAGAPLAVHVDGVLADRRPLDPRGASVEPGTRLVSIHYATSSLLDPPSLRFRHRLDGFDRDWVDAGADRTADYTNLPPGTYAFRVAVRAAEETWSETAAPLVLTVRPRYYQTSAFAALCTAAAAAALWGLHRLRLHQLRRRFAAVLEERARLARDVHDTLAQGFTGILLHLDSVSANLARSPEAALHHLDRVRHTARRSLAEARQAIWDLRHRSSERGALAAALSDFAAQTQTESATRVAVRTRGRVRPLPEDVERELASLAREAVTNAVRHARARTIRVAVCYARAAVHLVIRDDGRGFDPADAPPGHFGLLGMRERTRRLRGRLRLRSRPGHGTLISIRVPLGSEYSELRRALAFPETARRPA